MRMMCRARGVGAAAEVDEVLSKSEREQRQRDRRRRGRARQGDCSCCPCVVCVRVCAHGDVRAAGKRGPIAPRRERERRQEQRRSPLPAQPVPTFDQRCRGRVGSARHHRPCAAAQSSSTWPGRVRAMDLWPLRLNRATRVSVGRRDRRSERTREGRDDGRKRRSQQMDAHIVLFIASSVRSPGLPLVVCQR